MRQFSLLSDQTTRADKVLSALFDWIYSRSKIQKWFAIHQISIRNCKDDFQKIHHSPKYYLKRWDIVEMDIQSVPSTLTPDFRPLEIIYENDDFLVVSKDAGINTHPTPGSMGKSGTLVNQLIAQVADFDREQWEDRPWIVHRLDKQTSGLLLVAKNDQTIAQLQKLIHDHKVEKTYLALVIGEPKNHSWTITSLIGRDPENRVIMTIKNPVDGRNAITHYSVIQTFEIQWKKLSIVKVNLETGRTHQIRLHMTSIWHPILGDTTYGIEHENIWCEKTFWLTRQFLHAWKLDFEFHGIRYQFCAPLKQDLEKVLTKLNSKLKLNLIIF